ncbi:hypothetical protein L345_08016, partial [Ophiophagus hannah]
MAGDHNMVMNNGIDKSNPSKAEIKYNNADLRKFININRLKDVWRELHEKYIKWLEEEIRELESKYIESRKNRIMLGLSAKRKELQNIEIEQVQRNLIYLNREFYENSNKNSRMLARATQVKKAKSLIGVIKKDKGERCNMMREKLLIFQKFFEKLYKGNDINMNESILALDVFKVSDCVEWPTSKILIEKLGFGKTFRKGGLDINNQLKVIPDIIAVTRDLIWRDIELKELREIELWNKWRYRLMPGISPLTPVVEMEKFPKIELKEWISILKENQIYKREDWKNKIKNITKLKNVLSDINLIQLKKWIKVEEGFEEKDS